MKSVQALTGVMMAEPMTKVAAADITAVHSRRARDREGVFVFILFSPNRK
jgi:hypothetical protein